MFTYLEPKQAYNYAEFERPHLNSVWEKTKVNIFVKSEITSIFSHD